MLIAGNANAEEAASAAWVDSWHMSGKLMACLGEVDSAGAIKLRGAFEAPPGPDWGWTIEVSQPAPDTLKIVMCNVTPGGDAEMAVQANFTRRVA